VLQTGRELNVDSLLLVRAIIV